MVDINIDLSKCDVNTTTAEYVPNLLLNNFYSTVIMPTRITSRTATLIDNIQGGPKKSKPLPIFQKIVLKIANEIRFLRKVKV